MIKEYVSFNFLFTQNWRLLANDLSGSTDLCNFMESSNSLKFYGFLLLLHLIIIVNYRVLYTGGGGGGTQVY